MWKHKSKFKGRMFFGNYEFSKKAGKRLMRMTDILSGREVAPNGGYGNHQAAKADGWIYVGGKK